MERKEFRGGLSNADEVPQLGVGGGAYYLWGRRRIRGRMILRAGMKPKGFVRRQERDLGASLEQAFVSVQLGDVILEFSGIDVPATPENQDLIKGMVVVKGFTVVGVDKYGRASLIVAEETSILPEGWNDQVPWEILGTTYNRDGKPFVA